MAKRDTLLDTQITEADLRTYTRIGFAMSTMVIAYMYAQYFLRSKGITDMPKVPGEKYTDAEGNTWDVAVPDPEGVKQSPGVKLFAQWLYEYQQAHGHDPSEAEMAEQWGKGGVI